MINYSLLTIDILHNNIIFIIGNDIYYEKI